MSFSGMADVLGWPKRPPLVADADRANVLASWAPQCNGVAPCQRFVPFAEVRSLSPEAFVRVLAHDLKVRAFSKCPMRAWQVFCGRSWVPVEKSSDQPACIVCPARQKLH